MTQLRDFDRYIMYVAIGPAYDFNVQLGYWLPNSDPAEPSWIGVTLESNPKSKIRKDVISVFRDFRQKNAGWADEDLDNEKEWATIFKGTSLPQFMSQPNHVKAIREYFSGLLDELKRFRSTYPKLPWKSRSVDADEQREE